VGERALGVCIGDGDIDAQHLAQQACRVLRVVVRIVPTAAIAHADVQVAVTPEMQVAAAIMKDVSALRTTEPVGRSASLRQVWFES